MLQNKLLARHLAGILDQAQGINGQLRLKSEQTCVLEAWRYNYGGNLWPFFKEDVIGLPGTLKASREPLASAFAINRPQLPIASGKCLV